MAILIKNRKMPPSCGYCPCFGTGYGGQWWCHAIEARVVCYEGRRDEHCPLVEADCENCPQNVENCGEK